MAEEVELPFDEIEEDQLDAFSEPFERKVFLLIGHGSAGFANLSTALREADGIAARFDKVYGRGEWLVVFGGDPPSSKKPNIGNVVKHLATHRGVPVLAVQKLAYRASTLQGKGGVDSSCSAVVWYQDDPYDADKIGPYGGTDEFGAPVGATRIYLGEKMLPHMAGVIAFGGGPTALSEAKYAVRLGLPFRYIRCPALHPKGSGPCGAIDAWATELAAACGKAREADAKASSKEKAPPSRADGAAGGGGSAGGEGTSEGLPPSRPISDGLRGDEAWPAWAQPEDGICMTMH